MSSDHPVRRVQRMRHELRSREVRVARVQTLGPGFVSVTFAGESLADFRSDGFDDHVKFMFTDAAGSLVRRDYTPRRFDVDARELTVEFAVHGHGQASEWARRAQVGQHAVIGGPRGSMIIPLDYDWHLLAGDATALPAIARRLEELPAGAAVQAVIQVADGGDRRRFDTRAAVDLHWVRSGDELVDAVRALPRLPGDGHAWCAGEAGTMARLRQVLIDERAHPRESLKVAAYWKPGASDFHDNLDRPVDASTADGAPASIPASTPAPIAG